MRSATNSFFKVQVDHEGRGDARSRGPQRPLCAAASRVKPRRLLIFSTSCVVEKNSVADQSARVERRGPLFRLLRQKRLRELGEGLQLRELRLLRFWLRRPWMPSAPASNTLGVGQRTIADAR